MLTKIHKCTGWHNKYASFKSGTVKHNNIYFCARLIIIDIKQSLFFSFRFMAGNVCVSNWKSNLRADIAVSNVVSPMTNDFLQFIFYFIFKYLTIFNAHKHLNWKWLKGMKLFFFHLPERKNRFYSWIKSTGKYERKFVFKTCTQHFWFYCVQYC